MLYIVLLLFMLFYTVGLIYWLTDSLTDSLTEAAEPSENERQNFAILLKFGRLVHCRSQKAKELWKSILVQIQDGGRARIFNLQIDITLPQFPRIR